MSNNQRSWLHFSIFGGVSKISFCIFGGFGIFGGICFIAIYLLGGGNLSQNNTDESPPVNTSTQAESHEYRTWKSTSGSFSVEAKFVKWHDQETLILERKDNQTKIKVQLILLGAEDQEYVQSLFVSASERVENAPESVTLQSTVNTSTQAESHIKDERVEWIISKWKLIVGVFLLSLCSLYVLVRIRKTLLHNESEIDRQVAVRYYHLIDVPGGNALRDKKVAVCHGQQLVLTTDGTLPGRLKPGEICWILPKDDVTLPVQIAADGRTIKADVHLRFEVDHAFAMFVSGRDRLTKNELAQLVAGQWSELMVRERMTNDMLLSGDVGAVEQFRVILESCVRVEK